jgi:hypothetical protein
VDKTESSGGQTWWLSIWVIPQILKIKVFMCLVKLRGWSIAKPIRNKCLIGVHVQRRLGATTFNVHWLNFNSQPHDGQCSNTSGKCSQPTLHLGSVCSSSFILLLQLHSSACQVFGILTNFFFFIILFLTIIMAMMEVNKSLLRCDSFIQSEVPILAMTIAQIPLHLAWSSFHQCHPPPHRQLDN